MNSSQGELILLAAFCAATFCAFRIERRHLSLKVKQVKKWASATMQEIFLGAGQIILIQILIAMKLAGNLLATRISHLFSIMTITGIVPAK